MASKRIMLIMLLFMVALTMFSQYNKRQNNNLRKNAISFSVFGVSPYVGITYERLISEHFSAEIGLGIISAGIGGKYYPWKIEVHSVRPYIGISTMFAVNPSYFYSGDTYEGIISYIPIGMSVFGRRGFNFCIDLGPALGVDSDRESVVGGIWGNMKLGYWF